MFSHEIQLRIRYEHTDRMGYCYYGNYPSFYEAGRTEMMRDLGMSYRDLEDSGILMPVINMNIEYHSPAFYDDLITVRTILKKLPSSRIFFDYEIYNQQGKLINSATTTLVFLNAQTNKPQRVPEFFLNKIAEKFR
ncbi:MAG: thioesterase [Bacteroidetes bacterium GWF2_38_335]|nr:MAG: thioesterase [Bacteroidetes bacterium GWF2_38_335]OFY79079.1 MAG: thioesterase [Bacteroidetes bacterium RIFOXYA12_FULL_38_20]HBS86167.1 thioesterase [Bacteroidales bacterium]